ncbi:hypothetical protein [Sphingomonas daechungensis]|uniref:hypothetical protein n=1 Tax=Sphingomonas daechungensis TaxID=1176646 RepID=UPI003784480C
MQVLAHDPLEFPSREIGDEPLATEDLPNQPVHLCIDRADRVLDLSASLRFIFQPSSKEALPDRGPIGGFSFDALPKNELLPSDLDPAAWLGSGDGIEVGIDPDVREDDQIPPFIMFTNPPWLANRKEHDIHRNIWMKLN